MKRLSLIFAAMFLVSAMVQAAVTASGSCGADGDNLTWQLTDDGTLTISGTGNMADYYIGNEPWYSKRSIIKKIVISDGVASIGNYAFYGYSSLTTVSISNGVTSIGYSAFYGCSSLTDLTIGEGVTTIGVDAFGYCSALTTVSIPNSVTSIGQSAFRNCSSLTDLTIGEGVTTIGVWAFEDCSALTTVSIPNSVTSIGHSAFYRCSSLTDLTIGECVTTIGESAFAYIGAMSVKWNAVNVKTAGSSRFPIFFLSKVQSVEFSDKVENIPDDAFHGCSALITVSIPNGVTSIGSLAFSGCSSLTDLTIGEGVTTIGGNAFASTGAMSVKWNAVNVQTEGSTFSDSKVRSVTFSDKVEIIPEAAFYECTDLATVTISNSVTSIGGSAFSGCSALTDLTIGKGVTTIGKNAFKYCSALTTVSIPNSVASIGDYAFYKCSLLTDLTIGEGVKTIGKFAFEYCSALTTVLIPNSVTSIGQSAFESCSSLTDLAIGEGVKTIGDNAFANTGAMSVKWDAVNVEIAGAPNSTIFSGSKVQSVEFSSKVENIPSYVFIGCNEVETVLMGGQGAKVNVSADALENKNINPKSVQIKIKEGTERLILTLSSSSGYVNYVNSFGNVTAVSLPDTVRWYGNYYNFYDIGFEVYQKDVNWMLKRRNMYDVNNDGIQDILSDDKQLYSVWRIPEELGLIDGRTGNGTYFVNVDNDGKIDYLDGADSGSGFELFRTVESGTESVFSAEPTGELVLGAFDINSDGLTDYITDKENIYYALPDGSFNKTVITYIDTAAIDSLKYYYTTVPEFNPSAIPSLASGWIVGDVTCPVLSKGEKVDIAMDVDCNGYVDLVNLSTGKMRLNYGNNNFYSCAMPGSILSIKDLNNDGVPDFVVYDDDKEQTLLIYYEKNGKSKIEVLVSDLVPSNAWCYDFDKDGDADILLSFDYDSSFAHAMLVFYRNDGDGEFAMFENAYTDRYGFLDCLDIDNDGYYEIITAEDNDDTEQEGIEALKCGVDFKAEKQYEIARQEISLVSGDFREVTFFVGDLDNDGYMDCVSPNGSDSEAVDIFRFKKGAANTSPMKMEKPSAVYNAQLQLLNISWSRGRDNESSPVDLTYELRIGSAPGASDIMRAAAAADGRRLNMLDGNMRGSLNTWINVGAWTPGTYYIAVQAIDPNHRGGEWSDELVYRHEVIGSGFTLNDNEISTADTLTVKYNGVVAENYTYEWDFGDDYEIISQDGQKTELVYNTQGERSISLTIKDAEGNASPTTMQLVKVWPGTVSEEYDLGDSSSGNAVYADFDGDGSIELFGREGLKEYNIEEECYTSVGKLFNTKLSGDHADLVDYDMDGKPDIIGPYNKGNLFTNTSSVGNLNFSISTADAVTAIFENQDETINFADFDNDGLADMLPYRVDGICYLLQNSGNFTFDGKQMDMRSTQHPSNYSVSTSSLFVSDLNRNGNKELLWCSNYHSHNYEVAEHVGNFEFDRYDLPSLPERPSNSFPLDALESGAVADFDNDGYSDIAVFVSEVCVRIYYGDEDFKFLRTKDILLPAECSICRAYDIDNNGYVDLVFDACIAYNNLKGDNAFEFMGFQEKISILEDGLNCGAVPNNCFVDVTGDGKPEILSSYDYYRYNTRHTNTAPETPQNLRVRQTADGVVMQWDDAIDKETPAVQMRYNVSVKIKDAEGENAYLVSPMNCGSDLAAAIPGYSYVSATTYTMPLSRFEAGVEYELRVQSIDLWNAVSATSEPFVFTVDDAANILFDKDEVCVGEPVNATYQAAGFDGSGIEWTAEDGQTSLLENGAASMTWETSGVKTVSATVGGKTVSSSFYVREITDDLSIQLPARVLGGAPVDVVLPEIFTELGADVQISCEEGEIELTRSELSSKAQIRFPEDGGTYTLTVTYNDGACTTTEYQSVEVVPGGIVPAISVIGVDEESGKLKIQWQLPEGIAAMTDIFDGIVVYKESGRTNNFVKLAELPLESDGYVDISSNPSVSTTRYRIALSTIYGGESLPSKVHGSVHTMLNQGLNGAVNIIWTPYEGSDVLSYTILRGTSASDMAEIAVLPANSMSYTDMQAGGSAYVYAVSYEVPVSDDWSTALRSYGTASARSNVASSAEAPRTVFAASLGIMSVVNEKKLSAAQPTLHLFAEIMPVNATIQQVEWTIESGADLASISIGGELSLKSNEGGTVVVTAKAIDGSGLSATIEVPVTVSCTVSLDVNNPVLGSVSGGGVYESGSVITVSAIPADGCSFVNWSDGNTSAVREITVNGDLDLMANFSRSTAIDESVPTEWTAYSRGMSLVIAGSEDEACVFNLSGVLVYKGMSRTIPVPAEGMYIVRIGDRAEKVMVY